MTTTAPLRYLEKDVPASGVPGASRFLVASTPTGNPTTPEDNAILCWTNLLGEAVAWAPALEAEAKTIPLQRVVLAEQVPGGHVGDATHALLPRPAITAPVTRKVLASGKFASVGDSSSGELLDRVFLADRATFRSEVVFNAALEFAIAHRLDGHQCRQLSDALAIRLALNAGVVVTAGQLAI